MREELAKAEHTYLNDDTFDINQKWETWYSIIMDIINHNIPQRKLGKKSTPPWIDLDCIKLIQKKNRTLSKAKHSGNPETDKKFRTLRNKIKNIVNQKAHAYVNNLCLNLHTNPRKFWTFLKTKTKKSTLPQILRNLEGLEANTDIDKANMLNDYFYSTFNFKHIIDLPPIPQYQDPQLSSITLDYTEVSSELKDVNVNKAIGPDGIPSAVLKECHLELSHSLCQIYNQSLSTGKVPDTWKCANVVPIYKKGNANIVKNYRPVSLLSVISKILEKLIYNKVIANLIPKITYMQHGFMPGRSTTTQLLATFNKVNTNLDNRNRTDIIYFDLAKAFDSVPHNLLIHKLKIYGFNGPLLKWMKDYLTGRTQRVVINGSHSKWSEVKSGVPQGATLGPLNFLLFVNDLPESLSQGTQCGIFADDTKISRDILTDDDVKLLQRDIDNLYSWSLRWGSIYFARFLFNYASAP